MAEIDDKLNELTSQLGNLSNSFAGIGSSFNRISGELSSLSNLSNSLSAAIADNIRNFGKMSAEAEKAGKLISEFGDVMGLSASQLSALGKKLNVSGIDKLLQEWENAGANEEDLNEIRTQLKAALDTKLQLEQQYNRRLTDNANKLSNSILQETLLGSALQESHRKLALFNDKTATVKDRMIIVGDILLRIGNALTSLRDTIYKVQRDLGTTFATAGGAFFGDLFQVVASYFREGPALAVGETRDAIKAFQDEFGVILRTGEAGRIAQQAKALGTSASDFVKAQRAFLGAGGVAGAASVQQRFITEFRAAGLTANQALIFAAKNANLVAIAGVKYADSLARAAANATKIGVSLDKTEQFADTLVGDFEGALERFSELRALGVDVDFNKIAAVAATGTPEEIVKELSSQFGGNKALLEEVQRNRFLKVAIERDLGLNIADVQRLAGVAGTPTEQTVEEANQESLTTISKLLPLIATSLGALVTVMGASKGADIAKTLSTAGGAIGTLFGGPVGTAIGAAIGGAIGLGATKLFTGDDVISEPGYGNRVLLTSAGAIALNNNDTVVAGTQLMSPGALQSSRTPTQQSAQQTNVTVDMSKLEAKLDKLASAFAGVKIEMDGNTVGRVSLNARSPLDRLSVVG
jgi:hypothetical protein